MTWMIVQVTYIQNEQVGNVVRNRQDVANSASTDSAQQHQGTVYKNLTGSPGH